MDAKVEIFLSVQLKGKAKLCNLWKLRCQKTSQRDGNKDVAFIFCSSYKIMK